ncbi:Protein mab-21-like 3 [Amphibalanus amphitrite]|uniref:Protein mab-21-like 3 n=1 Tax=Amphibalanus amphitrite TaxID=1232801 RepID=A0A6A4WBX9_AMPAM|nr:Protein mab-21-like 3 [Amphibalanus amphitrite]
MSRCRVIINMGGSCSRRRPRERFDDPADHPDAEGGGGGGGGGAQEAAAREAAAREAAAREADLQLAWERQQQAALDRLRKEFKYRPELFIMSQMMMAVHFFKNFESDTGQVAAPGEWLMGDVMHYERRAGAGRALGHDLEYLILHDNVSVRPNNEPEDESDSADYKLVMIPSRNPVPTVRSSMRTVPSLSIPALSPGIRMRCIPPSHPILGVYPYAGAPVTEASAGHQMPGASSVCSEDSHGSFVMLPDSTTDEESEAPGHLPKYCFRKFEIIIKNDDDDDEDHWTPSRKEIHRYLSSELFVNHFTDHFGELAKLMARDVWLKQADTNFLRGPTVFCREQLADGLRTTALITPTLVSSSWPRAALEWGFRDRPRLVDMERRMQYQWPPERVVRELCQEGVCNLVPQGCYVREGLRAARHFSPRRMAVEWEVCFQQADMRLISSLEAVHVHFWAVAKLMFTHFLSEFRCLHERHIRHLIFWQFERNIRDWWPQALGGSLVELLRSLEKSVRERELKHYFVPRRNMLESETSEGLLLAQERLRRILENPVPNLLIALSRLRVRGDAFPEFDWQQLFHYLTVSGTDLLKEASPALREVPGEEPSSDAEDKDKDDDPMFVPTKEELREQDRQRQLRRRQAAEAAAAERRRQQRRRRRPLPDFADPHVKMQWLNGPDSRLRALRVLNMFVRHFSAMAERLLEHEALEPALSYADHTLNLCQLLEDQAGSEEADQARQRLWELRARAAALVPATEDDLPEQPDTDLLEVGAGGSSARGDNWTLGPAAGRGVRRDYNLEEAVAGGEQSAASRPARQAAEVATSA